MFLSKISIYRPVMMTMILLVFILFGGMAYFGLSLNMMPDVDVPYVVIQVVYPGAGPNEIETQVTKKIEDAVATVSEIKEITSYSMDNVAMVQMEFKLSKDIDIAVQEVKSKVDGVVNDLPDGAEVPTVNKWEIGAEPVVTLSLQGDIPPRELYQFADKRLKDIFSQITGVARVDITGGEEREIKIELEDRIVYQSNLTIASLNQILAASNMNMPAGQYISESEEFSVRLDGEFGSLEDIKDLKVPTANGLKKFSDIAKITDGSKDVRKRTTFYKNATKTSEDNIVKISLVKSSDGNAVDIAATIKEQLPNIKEELPNGVDLEILNDGSIFTKSAVDDTLSNIFLGIVLTSLVLLFFLHDLRSTFIVAIAMPASIVSTFLLMQAAGFSLNMMSLMGLSSSVGVLVANSVVVLENIFRHKSLGKGKKESADVGTSEMVVAVFASALTNVVVFLPIASMSSMVGQFFKEFALTVTFATVFSIFISFTLTPMLASLVLPDRQKRSKIGEALEKMFHSWEKSYQKILRFFLANKGVSFITIIGSFGLVFVALYVGFNVEATKIGFEFMPLLDEGDISIKVELPQGTNLDYTAKSLKEIEAIIAQHDEVKHIITTLGESGDTNIGTNLAIMNVKLVDVAEREATTDAVNTKFINDLAVVPNAVISPTVQSSVGGGGGAPIDFSLTGVSMDELVKYKDIVLEKGKKIDGLINFDASIRSEKPEVVLSPKRKELIEAGLTVYDLALVIRGAVEGLVATQYKELGESYDIRVTMLDEVVNTSEKIGALTIVSQTGKLRLDQLADIRLEKGVNSIQHKDKIKAIQFTGSPAAGVPLGDLTSQLEDVIADMDLPTGYSIVWGGDAKMMQETMIDMGRVFLIAIILTYMLLAALLESFLQPLFILGTVPLAMIGVVIIMIMSGQSMNMFSMLAIIMLVGIVVNNAILMLDYTNQLYREKGLSAKDALIEACPTKLKPIIMSTLAIVLGMLPMAMGIGSAGKEFRQSMGLVTVGGLIASTIFALIVIPALYYFFARKDRV